MQSAQAAPCEAGGCVLRFLKSIRKSNSDQHPRGEPSPQLRKRGRSGPRSAFRGERLQAEQGWGAPQVLPAPLRGCPALSVSAASALSVPERQLCATRALRIQVSLPSPPNPRAALSSLLMALFKLPKANAFPSCTGNFFSFREATGLETRSAAAAAAWPGAGDSRAYLALRSSGRPSQAAPPGARGARARPCCSCSAFRETAKVPGPRAARPFRSAVPPANGRGWGPGMAATCRRRAPPAGSCGRASHAAPGPRPPHLPRRPRSGCAPPPPRRPPALAGQRLRAPLLRHLAPSFAFPAPPPPPPVSSWLRADPGVRGGGSFPPSALRLGRALAAARSSPSCSAPAPLLRAARVSRRAQPVALGARPARQPAGPLRLGGFGGSVWRGFSLSTPPRAPPDCARWPRGQVLLAS